MSLNQIKRKMCFYVICKNEQYNDFIEYPDLFLKELS